MNKLPEFISEYRTAKFEYSLFKSIFHTAWFTLSWWKYLLEDEKKYCVAGQERKIKIRVNFRKFYCRMRGHAGVWFYNSYGLEPDMTCKFCGDDLG